MCFLIQIGSSSTFANLIPNVATLFIETAGLEKIANPESQLEILSKFFQVIDSICIRFSCLSFSLRPVGIMQKKLRLSDTLPLLQ